MSLAWQLALGNDTPTTVTTAAGRIEMVGPQYLDIAGGSPGQVLTTDGAANLRWSTPSGGPPPTGGGGAVDTGGGGAVDSGGGGAVDTGGGASTTMLLERIAALEARLAALETR